MKFMILATYIKLMEKEALDSKLLFFSQTT